MLILKKKLRKLCKYSKQEWVKREGKGKGEGEKKWGGGGRAGGGERRMIET